MLIHQKEGQLNYINSLTMKKVNKKVASFPKFTWPKTTLQSGTEHGLTSEFGTGSGGTHALWPAYLPLSWWTHI